MRYPHRLKTTAALVLLSTTLCAAQRTPAMPESHTVARSNWAVALAGDHVFAFYGLGTGKTHADIARDVHATSLLDHAGERGWQAIAQIPVSEGRLASAAVTIGERIYLIGGYTVAADGSEKSAPEILRFDPEQTSFAHETNMPVPVDDTVALAWRDRWIVLISGWYDTANVADVQIYDTRSKNWTSATAWPGKPVFGHAGALFNDVVVVCDGVAAVKGDDGKNQFALSDQCWRGQLDVGAIGKIAWHPLPAHPGKPLYRSGATATRQLRNSGHIVFAGGSERPYNYDGIGYDGLPAEPSSAVISYDIAAKKWMRHTSLPTAGMDFRGLIEYRKHFHLIGGMRTGQSVSGEVIRFQISGAAEQRD